MVLNSIHRWGLRAMPWLVRVGSALLAMAVIGGAWLGLEPHEVMQHFALGWLVAAGIICFVLGLGGIPFFLLGVESRMTEKPPAMLRGSPAKALQAVLVAVIVGMVGLFLSALFVALLRGWEAAL